MAITNSCKTKDRMDFLHDDGPDFNILRGLYDSFKTQNPVSGNKMQGFIPSNDKEVPGLQIADILANRVMNRTTRYIQRGDSESSEILMSSRSKLYVWNQKFGEYVLAANMKSRGIAIPKSLSHTTEVLDKLGI